MAIDVPVTFSCEEKLLFGIIHCPGCPSRRGILIIVGGPQYRVGSHRQFVLLARFLADNGIPVMRFDYRGMGDSEGEPRSFNEIDADVRSAIDVFFENQSDLEEVIIWGLCDAASAALFYAHQDKRVKGLVLLNPWVYTEEGAAKSILKHYYLQRLVSLDFWGKVARFEFNYNKAILSFLALLVKVFKRNFHLPSKRASQGLDDSLTLSLPDRMRRCLGRFGHPVLLILSGNDLTADEFRDVVNGCPKWQALLEADLVTRLELEEADHTFSSAKWRKLVAEGTLDWVRRI